MLFCTLFFLIVSLEVFPPQHVKGKACTEVISIMTSLLCQSLLQPLYIHYLPYKSQVLTFCGWIKGFSMRLSNLPSQDHTASTRHCEHGQTSTVWLVAILSATLPGFCHLLKDGSQNDNNCNKNSLLVPPNQYYYVKVTVRCDHICSGMCVCVHMFVFS